MHHIRWVPGAPTILKSPNETQPHDTSYRLHNLYVTYKIFPNRQSNPYHECLWLFLWPHWKYFVASWFFANNFYLRSDLKHFWGNSTHVNQLLLLLEGGMQATFAGCKMLFGPWGLPGMHAFRSIFEVRCGLTCGLESLKTKHDVEISLSIMRSNCFAEYSEVIFSYVFEAL